MCRRALHIGYRSGGTLRWGQKRNNSSAVNQTDGSQWASEGPARECETPVCLPVSISLHLSDFLLLIHLSVSLGEQGDRSGESHWQCGFIQVSLTHWQLSVHLKWTLVHYDRMTEYPQFPHSVVECVFCTVQETRCNWSGSVWTTTWVEQTLQPLLPSLQQSWSIQGVSDRSAN